MNSTVAMKLRPGDDVFWNDPDEGMCSRTLTIRQIKVAGTVAEIETDDGDMVVCFVKELS